MASLWKQVEDSYTSEFASLNAKFDEIYDNYTHVLPFGTAALYVAMVFLLPPILVKLGFKSSRNGPGRLLTLVAAAWNLFLTIGSALMVYGIASRLYSKAQTASDGFLATICDRDHTLLEIEPLVFWANLFVWSKYAELIDTLLLILKKPERPIPFLHWFHHATVLLFTWYAIVYEYTVGIWFGVINGCVHTVMYFYYFLTELGYKPSWAIIITIIQISQMVIGIVLNVIWAQNYFSEKSCTCKAPETMLGAAVAMYASYLFLFVKFFVGRYFGSSKSKAD